MKIYLKQDWDYQPSYKKGNTLGHFIGREREKNGLVDEFLRKDSGSILVSGARGVGKTALVYKALQEATEKDKRIVPIVMNSSQLEIYTKNPKESLAEIILKNLIRRLYGYFQTEPGSDEKLPKGLRDDIGNLYKKAVAAKFEITEKLSQEERIEKLKEESIIEKLSETFDREYLTKVFYVVSAVIVLFLPSFWGIELINRILAIILFLIPKFKFERTKQWIEKFITKLSHSKSAEMVYREDNSLSNLEYELNNILKNLLKAKKKIIFVIDELDKIEKGEEDKKDSDAIFEIIKTYKNLFTLSSALFVFITSSVTYERIIEAKKDKGKYYTLFTNRIFLNRPDFPDLENFIDSIIYKIEVDNRVIDKDFNKKISGEDLKLFRNFKNYLCYKAKSDYFDLYLTIRDYITSYVQEKDKRFPVIEIEKLTFDERLKSKLQEALCQIFQRNRTKEPSEWHENDVILSDLYDFIDDNYNIDFEFDFDQEGWTHSIIGDYLIPYLDRLEIIQKIETKSKNNQGEPINVGVFQWTGVIPGEENKEDVPPSPDILFNKEKNFLRIGEKYVQQVNDIDDIINIIMGKREKTEYKIGDEILQESDAQEYTGINSYNIFEKYKPYLEGLEQVVPKNVNKQDLITYTKELEQEIQKLKAIVLRIFTNLIKKAFSQKEIGHTEQQLKSDPELFNLTSLLRNRIIEQGLSHFVIFRNNPPKSKQLLITLNIEPILLSEDVLQFLEQNEFYRLANIQTDYKLNYSGKDEMIEEKTRYDTIKVRGGKTKRKRRIEKIKKKRTSFINIKVKEDYTVFVEPIKDLIVWFGL